MNHTEGTEDCPVCKNRRKISSHIDKNVNTLYEMDKTFHVVLNELYHLDPWEYFG